MGVFSFVIFGVGTDCALVKEDERPRKKMQPRPEKISDERRAQHQIAHLPGRA